MCQPGTCVFCQAARTGKPEFAEPYPEIELEEERAGAAPVSEEERMAIVEHLFQSRPHTWLTVKAIAVLTAGRAMSDDEVETVAKSLRIRVVRPLLEPEFADEVIAQVGKTLTDVPRP